MQSQRQTSSAAGHAFATGVSVDPPWPLDQYRSGMSRPGTPGGQAAYDEYFDAGGAIRPRWRSFDALLRRAGAQEIDRRWSQAQRLIYDNAVAYGHNDSESGEELPRPWALDPLPVLITQAEWRTISEGLAQRAHLLELILQDLYGPQELVRSGVLPPEVVFGHPGYLMPLRRPAGDAAAPRMLRLYSADLGRSPDGGWWVMADRTEAPSGIGFALENRIVTSRMMPEAFRECRVRRLAGYFAQLRETLQSIAPQQVRNPRVAILSQGPGQPNYFEDAYLARYLGFTLVEGEDLTVRNRRLWLKTLEGLTPIDVLIRRPSSALCDPLELGGESPVGVAGLIQATRDERLALANDLGSGLVESPVFMAFLPRLCQHLLGEKPKLPGVATYWCGEPDSLKHVLANLEGMVLKRAYRLRGTESLLNADLRNEPLEQLADRIRENPRAYVGQERLIRSTAPLWTGPSAPGAGLTQGRISLRAFAVAAGDGGHRVLEGALARTTAGDQPLETSLLSGEGSKDVWVLSDQPVEPITLLSDDDGPIELVRVGPELPSRVADNSFWLGRHLERADAKARLARTVANLLSSEDGPSESMELPALLRALAAQGQLEPGYALDGMRDRLPRIDASLPAQVLSPQHSGSLAATIDRVFSNAAQVRDRLSRDTWRILLRLEDSFPNRDAGSVDLTDVINTTDDLIVDLSAIGGMVIESMTRTQFYRFLDIGRRLERAMQLVDLLRACLLESGPCRRPLLEALLETSDSLMTYRSRYRANVRFAAVLDLLLTDGSNPRSLAFQLQTLERHSGKLPRDPEDQPGDSAGEKLAMSMAHAVRMAAVADLADAYEMGNAAPLTSLLDKLERELPALSDALSLKYLVHAGAPRQLSPL